MAFQTLSKRTLAIMLGVALVSAGVLGAHDQPAASALSGSDFNAGNIISDAEFYNGNAMSQSDIQSFLDLKIGSCSNGQCLNVLSVSVASRPRVVSDSTGNVRCESFTGGTLSAAAIIYGTQVACGISARVILVTLQKEQGLITSKAPSQAALDRAMGFACPDTEACAASSLGFGNQVYAGTLQLKTYKASHFARQPGLYSIEFKPNSSCGSSVVSIQNYATAALYNYTPYQPNPAALSTLSGTGDGCSSYGNRNFWAYYNTWFSGPVTPLPLTAGENLFVFSRDAAGILWLYSGDGHGGWKPRIQTGTGWQGMTAIVGAEDFSGDGHQDVLARDGTGVLWLYPGDGAGGWSPRVQLGTGWQGLMIMGAGDFDGDGRQDVFARDGLGTLWLYRGDGKGGWQSRVQIGTGWTGMSIIGAGDFNGDGFEDLFAQDGSGKLWLYLGNGKGGWLPRVDPGVTWDGINAVVGVGDFDGDGTSDSLARDAAGILWLYPGNGSGGWNQRVQVGTDWNSLAIAGSGDLDGDAPPVARKAPVPGENLYVFGQDTGGALWTYPGNTSGSFSARIASGSGISGSLLRVGDLNNDGHQDLLSIDGSGVARLYPGAGSGTFAAPVQITTSFVGMDSFFSADFNGDGKQDVIARSTSGDLYLYPGNGSSGFTDRVLIGTGWQGMTILPGGDFNGDGKADVLARDTVGNLWLYRGNGQAGWLPRIRIGTGWTGMGIVGAGDFNGDGYQDILTADGAGQLYIYRGNGKSGWSPRIVAPTEWNNMTWMG